MFHIHDEQYQSELYSLINSVYKEKKLDAKKISSSISDKKPTSYDDLSLVASVIDNLDFPTMSDLLKAIKKRRKQIKENKDLEENLKNYDLLNKLYISIENQLIENLNDPLWSIKFNQKGQNNQWDTYDIVRINLKELIRSSQIIQTYKLSFKMLIQQMEVYIFNRNIPDKPYKVDSFGRLGVFITVDEAHRYFKKDLLFIIDFFASIAKQGRKRIIELCMISQNISDFYRQSDSKDIEQKASDIIKNSGYKFVMQVAQDYDRIYDFIESGYQLSEAEKLRIKALNRYRVYLIQGPFKRTLVQTHALQETKDFYGDDL